MAFASWWYATVNACGVMIAAGFGDPVFDVVLEGVSVVNPLGWKAFLVLLRAYL